MNNLQNLDIHIGGMYISALERPPDMASSMSLVEFLLTLATLNSLALLPSANQGDKSTLTEAPEVAWLSLTVRFLWVPPPNQELRKRGLEGEVATELDAKELLGLRTGELSELLEVGCNKFEELVAALITVVGDELVTLGMFLQELELVVKEASETLSFLLASKRALVTSSII